LSLIEEKWLTEASPLAFLELYTELMMTQVLEKSDEVSVSSISLKKPDKFYHFPHFSIQLYEGI